MNLFSASFLLDLLEIEFILKILRFANYLCYRGFSADLPF